MSLSDIEMDDILDESFNIDNYDFDDDEDIEESEDEDEYYDDEEYLRYVPSISVEEEDTEDGFDGELYPDF